MVKHQYAALLWAKVDRYGFPVAIAALVEGCCFTIILYIITRPYSTAGCRLLYLPAYSPDLNPIEKAFSKLKRGLRDWAARTVEGVYEGLRQLIVRFGPAECLNYFRHGGYTPATTT